MNKNIFAALAVLVGTIIGAGFLGIPYVVGKSGFLPGFFYLIFVFIFLTIVKLYLGEITLRTKGNHQLTGYAEKYLGKPGKFIMFFAMIFGIYSAIIAYLIGEGESFSFMIFGNLSYTLHFALAFWLIMTILSYIGLRALKQYEKIGFVIMMAIIILIFGIFFKGIQLENLSYVNSSNMFLPFGVIFFAFLGFSAMPAVERILNRNGKAMKKTIILGNVIPLIFYFIFTLVIVGNFGTNVPEVATLSLGRIFSFLGVIAMFTSFFVLTIAIRDMFRFDFKLGRFKGWVLSSFTPLFIFLLIFKYNLAGFVQILSTAGIVSGGITGILVLIMSIRAKKLGNRKPEYKMKINWPIIIIMSLIFLLAVLLQLFF